MVQLISLVAVQLGLEYYHLFTDFKPTLIAVMKDHTVSVEERSAVSITCVSLNSIYLLCVF